MNVEVRYRGGGEDLMVGLLSQPAGEVLFEYDGGWRGRGLELSPFAVPTTMSDARAPRNNRFHGLFSLFADSLPDWWGEKLMRRYFTSVGRDWRDLTPLDKLCFQGDRAMGALAYEPAMAVGAEEGQVADFGTGSVFVGTVPGLGALKDLLQNDDAPAVILGMDVLRRRPSMLLRARDNEVYF